VLHPIHLSWARQNAGQNSSYGLNQVVPVSTTKLLGDTEPYQRQHFVFPAWGAEGWVVENQRPKVASLVLDASQSAPQHVYYHTFSTCKGRPSLFHFTTVAGGSASTGQRI
jgi:hypothetical protein